MDRRSKINQTTSVIKTQIHVIFVTLRKTENLNVKSIGSDKSYILKLGEKGCYISGIYNNDGNLDVDSVLRNSFGGIFLDNKNTHTKMEIFYLPSTFEELVNLVKIEPCLNYIYSDNVYMTFSFIRKVTY